MKSFSSHSLRFQLTVLVLLVVIPGLMSVSWLTRSIATNWMDQMAKQNKEIRAQQLADKLSAYSNQSSEIWHNMAQVGEMVSMQSVRQEPILKVLRTLYHLDFVQTFDAQGQVVASTLEQAGLNVAGESWFQTAIAGQGPVATLLISQEQQQPMLCAIAPIIPPEKAIAIGILQACINLVTLTNQLGALQWGKTGYAMVLDRQGYLVVHPDRSLLSQSELINWGDRPEIQPALDLTPNHFEGRDRAGNLWLTYSLPLNDRLIISIQEQVRELGQIKQLFLQISACLILGTVLIIGASIWWITTGFIRPITDLVVVATTLYEGELTPRVKVKRDDEIGILVDSFNRMADQLQRSFKQLGQVNQTLEEKVTQRTIELEDANKKLNGELEKGRQIQRNFLPKRDEAKPVDILNFSHWEILAWFKPARQVAGDFYDAFELDDRYVGLVIADICDKGVGAALFMPLIQSLIRIFSGQTTLDGLVLTGKFSVADLLHMTEDELHHSPYQLNALKAVELTNYYLAKNHGNLGMFATLFFGVLDRKTGNLVYINGGHLPLFVIQAKGGIKKSLPPTGPAVGIDEKAEYKSGQITLDPGDLLLGYTDGVTDARSSTGEAFSLERLLSILEQPPTSATVLLERITTQVNYHRGQDDQFDDMTLIVVRRSPLSADSGDRILSASLQGGE